MGALKSLSIVGVGILAVFIAVKINTIPDLPELDPNPWWGPGEHREQNEKIRPFKIEIPQKEVDDLKSRLALPARIVPSLEGSNFTFGVNSVAMNGILKYWATNYDWRKRENKLNTYPHFKTRIEGLDIHFMRATPAKNVNKKVLPLMIIHGWPGSFVEFMDIIEHLITPQADSDYVFDVICPSIPGYGFSQAAAKEGMNMLTTAQIMTKLMDRLGFEKYYVQGGDWGSGIATDMATYFPQKLHGVHLNMIFVNTIGKNIKTFLGAILPSGAIMDKELESIWYPLSSFYGRLLRETGYMHLHATKPDTVGVALNSSPQGLAAYILEKFSTWTNDKNVHLPDGGLLSRFDISLDNMLDNICIYWFTGSITSSMRFYAENFRPSAPIWTMGDIPVTVPTGLASFKNDLVAEPRNFAAHRFKNIITYSNPSKGGHFAAMEVPKILAEDFHKFVNAVEKQKKTASPEKK